MNLYRKPVDQSRNEELLYADVLDKTPTSWSPDGKFLLYTSGLALGATGTNSIWALPMIGEHKPFSFVQTAASNVGGRFSPNGRWVVYQSNDSGQSEIYVAPFPGPGGKRQVSINGGYNAAWQRDGREFFYARLGDGQLMAAEVSENGAALEIVAVHGLFGPIPGAYDISPDGQQFLTTTAEEEASPSERLTVVQNWIAGIKK